MCTTESALKQWNRTQESLNEMGSKHVSDVVSAVRLDNDEISSPGIFHAFKDFASYQ